MRYLQVFNQRLRALRKVRHLSMGEIALACGVDEQTVVAWEAHEPGRRRYPGVAEVIDLCHYLGVGLEVLLDPETLADPGQMELPGLAFSGSDELSGALDELERVVNGLQEVERLDEEETELLRRFRKSSPESRQVILQLLGH